VRRKLVDLLYLWIVLRKSVREKKKGASIHPDSNVCQEAWLSRHEHIGHADRGGLVPTLRVCKYYHAKQHVRTLLLLS
jgi:hypothetical protein